MTNFESNAAYSEVYGWLSQSLDGFPGIRAAMCKLAAW